MLLQSSVQSIFSMSEEWKTIPFEKSIEKVKYTSKIASSEYLKEGTYPIVSQEEGLISGYWNNSDDVFRLSKPVVIFGDHTRTLKYVDFDFVLGADGVRILQPIEQIDTKFLLYYLQSCKIPSLGYSRHYKLLKDLNVPIPFLAEQKHIVAELDCLSDIIEKQKQQLKELDNLVQSIFYTTFGDPTSNNFGWKNRRLGEMVNSNMIGLTRSGSEQDASYKYLYFKMNNIGNEGGVDWSKTTRVNACAQEVEKYTLKEGDFLFNTRNSFELVGKTCVYPHIDGEICLFNNNIMRIDFKKEINATYMAYLFQDKYTKNQLDRIKKGTTSVWAIYYKDLEKIDILVPDIALQEEFAFKVAAIEKQKEIIKQSIEEAETLFNSRMDYYFN